MLSSMRADTHELDAIAMRWLMKKVREELVECHLSFDEKGITVEDNGDILVAGYASTGDMDRMDDIIEPAAFRRSLDHFLKNATILAHHMPTWPVGVPVDADIRERGVWLKTRIKAGFDPTTPEGRAYTGVKLGLIRAYSVGFRILASENVESEGTKAGWKVERVKRRITDLDWYETSVVVIPANKRTMFNVSKAVELGSDTPDQLYAEHRLKWALRLFGKPEEQEVEPRVARAVENLRLRVAAGGLAMATGAVNLRGSVGE